jgi:hypothetical protein
VRSTQGRPSGRPRSRSSIVEHPGASQERCGAAFPSSPRSPLLHNGVRVRWPIDADAPWKSHGRPRRTARTQPPTAFPPSLENRRTAAGFPQAPTGRRRSVASRSLGLSRHHERTVQSTEARHWQHKQPVHGIGGGAVYVMTRHRWTQARSELCLRHSDTEPGDGLLRDRRCDPRDDTTVASAAEHSCQHYSRLIDGQVHLAPPQHRVRRTPR